MIKIKPQPLTTHLKGHKHKMEEMEKLINKPLEITIRPRDYFLNKAQRSS